jgi:uncharacterized membrane protein (Fun14 family)
VEQIDWQVEEFGQAVILGFVAGFVAGFAETAVAIVAVTGTVVIESVAVHIELAVLVVDSVNFADSADSVDFADSGHFVKTAVVVQIDLFG